MQGSFAQAAFFYQNHIAALKLLELLEFGSRVRTVTLENYDKGPHIDDVIVENDCGTQYYQVKWSANDNTPYTIHNLIKAPKDKARSLIEELAHGYRSVEDKDNVEIILFSTKHASNQKSVRDGITKGLAEFIEELHQPFISSPIYDSVSDLPNYADYRTVVTKLQSASGLDPVAFDHFLKRLRFMLGQGDKEAQREKLILRLESLGIERRLYETLLIAAVEWSISGEAIYAADVLKRLGLADRFLDRITHDFKVEKEYFVGNPDLFVKLDDAISSLAGGFILLEGPPGSGKSTYLTEYKKRRTNVRFAYYCFVPDEIMLGNPRLEKDTFLKSLCVGIRNSFPDIEFPEPYSDDYESKLPKWLDRLNQLGSKLVFVIDGLDHVDKKRDQLRHPLTNFLEGKLPSNVFFLLSSQYPEALAHGIQTQLAEEPRRHIRVGRLSEGATQEFLERRGLRLSPKLVSLARDKSEGIPLYLHYIAMLLSEVPSNDYLQEKLLLELPYLENSKIDTYHEFLYEAVSKHELAAGALAILAVRREFTSSANLVDLLRLLGVQADVLQVERFCAKYEHLLRRSDAKGYTIFHNSFREFILRKAASLIKPVNDALVVYYKANPNDDGTFRNFYRHLFELERYEEILSECNEQWLIRSWQSFRPFEEISANLNLAWDAAIHTLSIREFVRIAFLEQRFGRASFNFENTESYRPARFLLSIHKNEEAIRRVWDGERVRISANEFYEFVLEYFKRTGDVLPQRIADTGFEQFQRRARVGETAARFEARALYQNWRGLSAEIRDFEWTSSDEHTHVVTIASQDQNADTNNSILQRIVDVLYFARKIDSLLSITQDQKLHPRVKTLAALRASELLLESGEVDEAARFIRLVDFNLIDRRQYNLIVAKFAEAKSYSKIANLVPIKFSPPSLFGGLTNKDRDFGLKDDLLQLYDNLRVGFLQQTADYRVYEIQSDSFNAPERNFFAAIIGLAQLWNESVQVDLDSRDKVERIKVILNELNMDYELRTRAFERTDLFTDRYIADEVHKIYADIFSFVASHINTPYIPEIASFWLLLDESRSGYKNQRVSIDFAKFLYDREAVEFQSAILSLLRRAEYLARVDEETLSLLTNLIECAEGYGYCGFVDEAERIWFESYALACGVYSRKDYQFSEAVGALERAHKLHPERSLNRLATLITLAHQLWGAADGRAVARAIGGLIDFSCEIEPALALDLLNKEDNSIFRGEVIEALTDTLAAKPEIDLRYVWAIVRTMDKWDNFQCYNADTYPTTLSVFVACLERKDFRLAEEIYGYVHHQLLVEKEMPGKLCEFAEKAGSKGIVLTGLEDDRLLYAAEWERELERKAQGSVSSLPKPEWPLGFEKPSLQEIQALAERDFDAFERQMSDISDRYVYASRAKDLGDSYNSLRETLSNLFSVQPQQQQDLLKRNRFANIRLFVKFKRAVLKLKCETEFEFKAALEKLFEHLLRGVCRPIFKRTWHKYVESNFDYREWVNKFASRTYRPAYWFRQEFLGGNKLIQLIERSAISDLNNWERFCREYLTPYELTSVLFAIASRLKNINKEHALELLCEAWTVNKNFFYTQGSESASSFLQLLFELDVETAKRTLLEAFCYQFKQFPKDIIYHLDEMLEYADFFGEDEIHEFVYGEYEAYVAKLAEGLAKKDVDFAWIRNHKLGSQFELALVKYLLHLFDHPQVEIRKLSLSSLFDRVKSDPKALSVGFTLCRGMSDNAKEHLLSLVYSVALHDYNLALSHKKELFALLDTPHFNIRQSAKEILLHCVSQGGHLDPGEVHKLELVNLKPQLIVASIDEGTMHKGKRFVPSSYQTELLHRLYTHHRDNNITGRVYTRLLNRGWTSESWMNRERAVHRAHNKNTNFDTIEINGPYFSAVQEILNETFVQEIDQQRYEDEDINRLKYEFRLYDPSDLLTQSGRPLEGVDWCGYGTSADEFVRFEDIKTRFSDFLERDRDWITVYEDGHQRTGEGDRTGRTTYFTIVAFLACKPLLPDLEALLTNQLPSPYYSTRNLFRHEIPDAFPNGELYPVAGIKPLIGFSKDCFRGQEELSIATLLPDVLDSLGLSRGPRHSLSFERDGEQVIDFSKWQRAYDQGRRRQKPKSAGVSLMIRRSLLDSYRQSRDYQLCFEVRLRRSTDNHVPENDMNWNTFQKVLVRAD